MERVLGLWVLGESILKLKGHTREKGISLQAKLVKSRILCSKLVKISNFS